jgi:protein phosphatase
LGVGRSLLAPDNVRVEGWRVRLGELLADADPGQRQNNGHQPDLKEFAHTWFGLAGTQPAIAQPLQALGAALLADTCPPEQLTVDLNYLLLREAAQVPLVIKVAGDTSAGPQQVRNEDACYPQGVAPDSHHASHWDCL